MRTQPIRALALVLLALLQLSASMRPSPVAAQRTGGPPLFLAMPDVYPDVKGPAMLLREPGREIIVLSDTATPEELGVALRLLARFRRDEAPPARGRGHMIPIVGLVTPTLTGQRRARLENALAELRDRPVSNVGGLGRGRWMPYQAP